MSDTEKNNDSDSELNLDSDNSDNELFSDDLDDENNDEIIDENNDDDQLNLTDENPGDSELSDDELNSDDIIDIDENYQNNLIDINKSDSIFINTENRSSKPIITKFEFNRILGERLCQYNKGSPLLISNDNNYSDVDYVKEEIRQKKTPFKIKRNFPNNRYEIWYLSELKIPKMYFL